MVPAKHRKRHSKTAVAAVERSAAHEQLAKAPARLTLAREELDLTKHLDLVATLGLHSLFASRPQND